MFTPVNSCLPMFRRVSLFKTAYSFKFIYVYPCLLLFTIIYSYLAIQHGLLVPNLPMFTTVYSCMFTYVFLCYHSLMFSRV